MLISFSVTAKLICIFVFAYAKSRFSHNKAHFLSFMYVLLEILYWAENAIQDIFLVLLASQLSIGAFDH